MSDRYPIHLQLYEYDIFSHYFKQPFKIVMDRIEKISIDYLSLQ